MGGGESRPRGAAPPKDHPPRPSSLRRGGSSLACLSDVGAARCYCATTMSRSARSRRRGRSRAGRYGGRGSRWYRRTERRHNARLAPRSTRRGHRGRSEGQVASGHPPRTLPSTRWGVPRRTRRDPTRSAYTPRRPLLPARFQRGKNKPAARRPPGAEAALVKERNVPHEARDGLLEPLRRRPGVTATTQSGRGSQQESRDGWTVHAEARSGNASRIRRRSASARRWNETKGKTLARSSTSPPIRKSEAGRVAHSARRGDLFEDADPEVLTHQPCFVAGGSSRGEIAGVVELSASQPLDTGCVGAPSSTAGRPDSKGFRWTATSSGLLVGARRSGSAGVLSNAWRWHLTSSCPRSRSATSSRPDGGSRSFRSSTFSETWLTARNGSRRTRAAFVIDDPNLHWPSYGHVHFADLAVLARSALPRRVRDDPSRRMVRPPTSSAALPRQHRVLSLLIHGNDHTREELARPLSDRDGQMHSWRRRSAVQRFWKSGPASRSRASWSLRTACAPSQMMRACCAWAFRACATRGGRHVPSTALSPTANRERFGPGGFRSFLVCR